MYPTFFLYPLFIRPGPEEPGSLIMLGELLAIATLKLRAPLHKREQGSKDTERCWALLKHTSRSFVAVIEQLHPEMRDAMMLFYLVLRALDTIEDDMGLDNAKKLPLLRDFRSKLKTTDWTFTESSETEKDRVVLVEFDVILREFHRLKPIYQDIIADITHKMGNGMADYIDLESQKNYDGVKTIKDYDLYCHYVAGIVGEGCTRMAIAANFSTEILNAEPELYESMGLFLQKTNIIRDYREDIEDGRSFWPREVWAKYTPKLSDFKDPANHAKGLECISDLSLLSLGHVCDVLKYLANVTDESYFRFCAIPQVMSIATLELVFQNPEVFERNVKIRKSLACKLIVDAVNMHNVYTIFRQYVRKIHLRNKPTDPNFLAIETKCGEIERYINANDTECPEYWELQRTLKPQTAQPGSEGTMVLLVGLGAILACSGIMAFVAWYMGAQFVGPSEFKDEITRFIDFFFRDINRAPIAPVE